MGEDDDLWEVTNAWLEKKLYELDVDSVDQLSPAKCMGPLKNDIATWLADAMTFLSKQSDMIRDLQKENGVLKYEVISSQQRVIQIQSELLTSKTEQLESLQTTVKTSVEDSVKTELVSYSAAVQTSQCSDNRTGHSQGCRQECCRRRGPEPEPDGIWPTRRSKRGSV